jgi:hypothetical protein
MMKTLQYVLHNQGNKDRREKKAHISKHREWATQQKKGKA